MLPPGDLLVTTVGAGAEVRTTLLQSARWCPGTAHPRLRRAPTWSALTAGGLSSNQVGHEDPLLVPVVRIGGLVQQQLGRGPAEPAPWLAHRGQRHGRGGREVDVVVADDREVVRNPEAESDAALEDTEGEQVVGAEDRGGPARGPHPRDSRCGAESLCDGQRLGLDHHEVTDALAGAFERLQGAVAALPDLAD